MDVAELTPVNLYRLSKITDTTESTINFVKGVGLIPKSVKCFRETLLCKKQKSYTNLLPM